MSGSQGSPDDYAEEMDVEDDSQSGEKDDGVEPSADGRGGARGGLR